VLVLQFERYAPGANIKTFGDALWWAFCTVTTVGYGDYTPVTPAGRVVAVSLMMSGVVLVGLIVASFSSWVLERATRGHEEQLPATRADIDRLEKLLAQARADAAAPGAGEPGAKGGADVGGSI
jgi:voltage-gated potassium channel